MNIFDLFSLKGKVAIVTGGYGHLGTAMSEALAEAGALVYVAGRNEDKFDGKFKEDNNIKFVEIDIASTESIQNCFKQVEKNEGKIDILINNATYLKGQFPEEITDDELYYSLDGVVGSVYRCIREILPFMRKFNTGKIINIASMYGIVVPNFETYEGKCMYQFNPPTYGAGKAGVIQLTKFFAEYAAQWGINVNAVSPGPFPNQKVQKDAEFISRLSKRNFLGRIGQPDDLKGTIVLLSSAASDFIDGQTIQVDGGWTQW